MILRSPGSHALGPLRAVAILSALLGSGAVQAAQTALSVGSASAVVPTTNAIVFPLSRSGDLGYLLAYHYRTSDSTAIGGIDYFAQSGYQFVSPSSDNDAVHIALISSMSSGPDRSLQLVVDGAVGIGPSPELLQQISVPAGVTPVAVATGDLDGDGRRDVVVANSSGNSISVVRNVGPSGIGLGTAQAFATGAFPAAVILVDVNRDGRPDVVTADRDDGTVTVLLNATAAAGGAASFQAPVHFNVGTRPSALLAADLNRDGIADLVVANSGAGTVSVLMGATASGGTTASFAPPVNIAAGNSASGIAALDVNLDGRIDLAVAGTNNSSVTLLFNTSAVGAATASFLAAGSLPVAGQARAVIAVDLNGDGRQDLAVESAVSNTISTFINTTVPGGSAPSFVTQAPNFVDSAVSGLAAADLNDDGKIDLVETGTSGGSLSALINLTVPGGLTVSFGGFGGAGTPIPAATTVADMNMDGQPDVIGVVTDDGTVRVAADRIRFGQSAAVGFTPKRGFTAGSTPSAVAAGDLNADGAPDVVSADAADDTISVLLDQTPGGGSTPVLAARTTFATGHQPTVVRLADLNGDGRDDVIVADAGAASVDVLLNATAPAATTAALLPRQTFAVGGTPSSIVVADINHDGRPDLVVANSADSTLTILLGTTVAGSTTVSFAAAQTLTVGTTPVALAAADLDGDGLADLVTANQGDNTVTRFLNTTVRGSMSASFGAATTVLTLPTPTTLVTVDLNGDGIPDYAATSGSAGYVAVRINRQGTLQNGPGACSNATGLVAADVDGDGALDLLASCSGSNELAVLHNITQPGGAEPEFDIPLRYAAGAAPSSVAVADFNADGKPDAVVGNAGAAGVSVLLDDQYLVAINGSPAAGTIVHDPLFKNGFE